MMDPSSVQHGGVEHVLHQHGDLGSVDPHLLSLPSVHSHHVLAQQVPLGGYMHQAHSLPMPPPVHIVPNPISQVSLTGSPYVHPGLMQEQTEKYGPLLFHKDDQGLYTCFFTGCGKKLKANFSRHVAKHEMDGDKMDPNLATQIQTSSASKNLGTTKICSHPTHQEWWGTSAEQPVTEFYKRCSKCKKCYIRLQQESKRQRLSLEGLNNSPMAPPVMMQPQYGGDMFPMGHVNTLPMLDHHLKRDDIDDEQGPSKRMRIEESASLMASLQELTYKHFKEMAELTARHSAHSRKLIAENTAVRMAAELRHTKDKGWHNSSLIWDQFRFKCLREREDLYQAQLGALNRELNGATIPVRPCRLCTKRIYSTFLYQCNLCNEEACIRCQAVMVCGVCGTKSCENCTIKHNWLIWCNRCHKTFCSNHRSISDDICPNCDAQKGMDMMMHPQHLTQHLPHDLDHSQHLHHSHSDYDHDPLPLHHHSSHHHSEELMGQHLKFEDLDNPHHPHPHSHELSNQHYDPHLHHDHHHHLQHEHMQHLHDLQHEHMQHLQHGGHDDHHHHYQDQQYDLQHLPPHDHIPSDLSEHHHHHHQQQYEQNYQDQQDYHHEQSIHHEQQSEQELEHQQQQHEQSHNYEQQNYQEQQDQASPSQNGVEQQNGQGEQGQESEQQNEEQGNQATSHNDGEESQQYLQQGEQEQQMINEQDQQQTSPDSQENKYDDLPPQSSQTIHKASLIR